MVPSFNAQPMNQNRVLVLFAHPAPHLSRVNRRLADAARTVAGVYVHDLYETYPDFYLDIAREHALIAQAGALVFLFPLHWYSMPSLLKEWCDEVFREDWTAGDGGGAARGKTCWLVTSTAGAADEFAPGARHGRPFADFLVPIEQMAAVCGMHWIAPHVLHGANEVGPAAVDAHIDGFLQRLRQIAGPEPLSANLPPNLNLARPNGT
jgi:glutathione-regulated potassium-efflux system ancillary protein KefF